MAGLSEVHSPVVSHANARNESRDGRLLRRPHLWWLGPMGLDVNTLFLITVYVEAMLGLLLLFAWVQNSGIHAVAWWGW